tara:strand:- start:16770 stop:20456 length:3687 start_codon:yes stop_codon:yes gene_type:complete
MKSLSGVRGELTSENYEDIVKDKHNLKSELKKIPAFKEFGLIMSADSNQGDITNASHNFLKNVMTSGEAMGKYLANRTYDMFSIENGEVVSNKTEQELNRFLTDRYQTLVNFSGNMVHKVGNKVVFKGDAVTIHNNHTYATYLQKLGQLTHSVAVDKNADKDFSEQVLKLNTGPVIAHLNESLRNVHDKKRELHEKGKLTPQESVHIASRIKELNKRRSTVKKNMKDDKLIDYLANIVDDASLALDSDVPMTAEDVLTHQRALALVSNAAKMDESNNIITYGERQDDIVMTKIKLIANDAADLESKLRDIQYILNKDNMEKSFGVSLKDDVINQVQNLKTALARSVAGVLGTHHIDNPIIQYIDKTIRKSAIESHSKATVYNDKIAALYRETISSGFDMIFMNQKNADGIPTGRVTGEFTPEYYEQEKNLKNKRQLRKRFMHTLDPTILFDLKASDPKRKALQAELKADLGDYMYGVYLKEAKSRYTEYKEHSKFIEEGNWSTEQKEKWEIENSPIARMSMVNKTTKSRAADVVGTDKFLVLVPKRVDSHGKDSPYYDKNYEKIAANPKALELYGAIRQAHINFNMALDNFDEKFKPPVLGYIGRNVEENIAKGEFKEAGIQMARSAITNTTRDSLKARRIPIDPITKEYRPEIQLEMHSIPDEIERRLSDLVKHDPDYKALIAEGDLYEAQELKKDYYIRIAKEVDADRSDNFLDSIVLTNYATSTMVDKRAIEAKVVLAANVMKENVIGNKDDVDAYKGLEQLMDETLKNLLDKEFYNVANQETTPGLKVSKEKGIEIVNSEDFEVDSEGNKIFKEERGLSVRSGTNTLRKTARLVMLSFSPITSLKNGIQGALMAGLKAAEGRYFNPVDLARGYVDIASAKNRKLLDQYYVVGDVGFGYNKRSIHQESYLRKVIQPMFLQTTVEKINQGSVTLAILNNVKVTNSKTKETIPLLDAMTDTWELGDEWSAEMNGKRKGLDLMSEVITTRVQQVNMQASGDYLSALGTERKWYGQTLMTFFKFAPEMIADNWGNKKMNYIEGRETHGRIRSTIQNVYDYTVNGNRDVFKDDDAVAEAKGTAYMAIVGLSLYAGTSLMFKALCDSPQCKKDRGMHMLLLNTLGQVTGEFSQQVSGLGIMEKMSSPFVAESLLNNWYDLVTNTLDAAIPGGKSGRYKTTTLDHRKGTLRLWNPLVKSTPLVSTTFGRYQSLSRPAQESGFTMFGAFAEDE